MSDLAKRAVACKHWRLIRGMTLLDGGLVTGERDEVPIVYARAGRHSADMLPDLTDPATLGCLLALVRKAWHSPESTTQFWPKFYDRAAYWETRANGYEFRGATEVEALIVALEAAP